jgi:hypothetical protein
LQPAGDAVMALMMPSVELIWFGGWATSKRTRMNDYADARMLARTRSTCRGETLVDGAVALPQNYARRESHPGNLAEFSYGSHNHLIQWNPMRNACCGQGAHRGETVLFAALVCPFHHHRALSWCKTAPAARP